MAKKNDELNVIADEGMNVILAEGRWRICSDPCNYILQRRIASKDETKKVRWATEGYYQRLEDLFDALLDKRLRESQLKSITALSKRITNTRKELRQLAKSLGKG